RKAASTSRARFKVSIPHPLSYLGIVRGKLTRLPGRSKIFYMRHAILLLAMLVFGLFFAAALAVSGQGGQGLGASWAWRYTPPSPSKSVEIGNFYLRKKDYRGALSRFEEALHTEPGYAPAYLGLGKVFERTGRKEEALEDFMKYLNGLPSDRAATQAKHVQEAIAHLKRQLTPVQVKSAEAAALAAEKVLALGH
ncbi:MAG: tetratricopeptide repeat protein, partial [Terriglobia bacterium]